VEDAWLRACAECGDPFVVDRECGFNRRYCSDACAAVARGRSVLEAQRTYRGKSDVRERHCKKARERRARQAEQRRDHIQPPPFSRVTVEGMVANKALVAAAVPLAVGLAPPAAGLARSAPGAAPAAAVPPAGVAPAPVARTPGVRPTARPRLAQWRLIVGHALAAHAEGLRRQGTVVHCACCGRPGRVVAVVVRAELEWRRQPDEDEG
jgi:hypothetical protein